MTYRVAMRRSRMYTKVLTFATVCPSWESWRPHAEALVAKNWCGPGAQVPVGKHCPRGDHLLAGIPTEGGGCEWRCCPKRSDGETYDCTRDDLPSRGAGFDGLRNFRAVRPMEAEPPTKAPPGGVKRPPPPRPEATLNSHGRRSGRPPACVAIIDRNRTRPHKEESRERSAAD